MRIPRGAAGGLLLACTASLAWAADQQNTKIRFDNSEFQNPDAENAAVFSVPTKDSFEGGQPRVFHWTATDTPVSDVTLYINDKAVSIASLTGGKQPAPESHAPPPDQSGSGSGGGGNIGGGSNGLGFVGIEVHPRETNPVGAVLASDSGSLITANATDDGTSGSITIVDLSDLATDDYAGKVMYFQVSWAMASGRSYSRNFTVAANATQLIALARDPTYLSSFPAYPEFFATSSGSPTAATNSPNQSMPPDASSKSHSHGSHHGLSTGAIAGIAVGAGIAGILVTGALIWLLIRSRRRRYQQAAPPDAKHQPGMAPSSSAAPSQVGGPYGAAGRGDVNRTQELVAEKEAAAGNVDVTPHSPHYSDDGGSTSAAAGGAVAAVAGASQHQQPQQAAQQVPLAQGQERSFTPYSDRQRETQPSPASGRALQTPYGHLVEEGMTEEDIRRLEAEERELDQAIEQAGGRR